MNYQGLNRIHISPQSLNPLQKVHIIWYANSLFLQKHENHVAVTLYIKLAGRRRCSEGSFMLPKLLGDTTSQQCIWSWVCCLTLAQAPVWCKKQHKDQIFLSHLLLLSKSSNDLSECPRLSPWPDISLPLVLGLWKGHLGHGIFQNIGSQEAWKWISNMMKHQMTITALETFQSLLKLTCLSVLLLKRAW